MSQVRVLDHPFPVDPLAACAGLATTPGTLLLHTQRPWHGRARSALLFDPRWTVSVGADSRPRWSGDVPAPRPPDVAPLDLAATLSQRLLPRTAGAEFLGLAGVLGYDLGAARWGVRHPNPPPFAVDDLWLSYYDVALLFDDRQPPRLVVLDNPAATGTPIAGPARLEAARDRLEAAARCAAPRSTGTVQDVEFFDSGWHRQAVDRVQRYLRAGDAYQINLTGLVRARTSHTPWSVFHRECTLNPVAFAAYLRTDRATLTSHSPERLLSVVDGFAETAPIKGTAPRGSHDLANEKNRAEHVMIVDLARNDLGRACHYGSIEVPELMAPLHLRGLTHLVSRVRGRLRDDALTHLLRDVFPGGSITGAPKRRAIEIISEVEQHARGPYTGSIGYIDASGAWDWNIAIRTAVWQNDAVHFGAGGGIVVDSDPALEYAEARLKAASFLDSLGTPAPTSAAAGG